MMSALEAPALEEAGGTFCSPSGVSCASKFRAIFTGALEGGVGIVSDANPVEGGTCSFLALDGLDEGGAPPLPESTSFFPSCSFSSPSPVRFLFTGGCSAGTGIVQEIKRRGL